MSNADLNLLQRGILEVVICGDRAIRPTRTPTGDPSALALRVEFDERPYFLGEPILVRCRLINPTEKSITMSYDDSATAVNGKLSFRIRAPQGDEIKPLVHGRSLSFGTGSVTIPPGQQFVHTINLTHDYAIVEPGKYEVTCEYKSDGAYTAWDQEAKKVVPKTAWAGSLKCSVGQLVVDAPTSEDDKAALDELLGARPFGRNSPQRYALMYLVIYVNQDVAHAIIERHPKSRYADYIRLHLGAYNFDRLWDSTAKSVSARAVNSLEAIDLARQPVLVREWVYYHLIASRAAAREASSELEPLLKKFRADFPDSPYPLRTVVAGAE